MSNFENIKYNTDVTGIARITLARAEKRNAQSMAMLVELNDAFDLAARDDQVKVIVLAAEGPDFSSGHDLSDRFDHSQYEPTGTWAEFSKPGAEGHMSIEQEFYLGFCWRWRNIPKPTVAEVQGRVIAGGLMLIWPCDIIIASEEASFSDPVVAFGVNGVEYFAHPWEVGVRKAKEMLFTGEALSAEEAMSLGMVNHVVPKDNLTEFTMEMASKIASRPSMGLKLAKQSVNQMQDSQGLWSSLQAAMSLQQLGHSHNKIVHGINIDPSGTAIIKAQMQKNSNRE